MTGSLSAMLSKLKSLPSVIAAGSWPNADAFPMAALKSLAALVTIGGEVAESLGKRDRVLVKAGKPHDGVGVRRH
jgi:hypothetical protein